MQIKRLVILSHISLPVYALTGGDKIYLHHILSWHSYRKLQTVYKLSKKRVVTHLSKLVDFLYLSKIQADCEQITNDFGLPNNMLSSHIISKLLECTGIDKKDAAWYFYLVSDFEDNPFMCTDYLIKSRIDKSIPPNIQAVFDSCCALFYDLPIRFHVIKSSFFTDFETITPHIVFHFKTIDCEYALTETDAPTFYCHIKDSLIEQMLYQGAPLDIVRYIKARYELSTIHDANISERLALHIDSSVELGVLSSIIAPEAAIHKI